MTDISPKMILMLTSIFRQADVSKLDVNWDTVATDSGYKNAKVAKMSFSDFKKKLVAQAASGEAGKSATEGAGKRKQTAVNDNVTEDEEAVEGTPAKKPKKAAAKTSTKANGGPKSDAKIKAEESDANIKPDDDVAV